MMSTEISPIIRFLYSKLLKKSPFIGAFFVPLHYNEKRQQRTKRVRTFLDFRIICLPLRLLTEG